LLTRNAASPTPAAVAATATTGLVEEAEVAVVFFAPPVAVGDAGFGAGFVAMGDDAAIWLS
jgi:hypothetical protein